MVAKESPHDRLQHDDDFHVALLHLAVKEDDILAIKDLVRVPNWIHAADRNGRNALHWVVAFGTKEASELLVSRTGEEGILHADKTGHTPLHFAAIWGRSDVAKMILARGANVNAPDKKGMTALHYAAQNSNPFLIRSLIKRGADKQARDTRRRIPYQVAVHWGSPEEILDLLDPGVSPSQARKVPNMPQARRFAESLSPKGLAESVPAPPLVSTSKDHPAELVKYDMQRQSDKTRNMLRKVVARRLKRWERPAAHSKDFALKALAARRRKNFVDQQMKKIQEMKRLEQMKKDAPPPKSSGGSSPCTPLSSTRGEANTPCAPFFSTRGNANTPCAPFSSTRGNANTPCAPFFSTRRKANTEASSSKDGTISRTPSGTKSSHSSSHTAIIIKVQPKNGMITTTFARPNSPNGPMRPAPTKRIRPNPSARDGWPSPPGSIRGGGRAGRPNTSPSKRRNKGKYAKEKVAVKPRRSTRTPSPARRALSEFVGTSTRHNALGKYPSPVVHKCIDIKKLRKQWL